MNDNKTQRIDEFAMQAMHVVDPAGLFVHGSEEPWANYAAHCYELAWAMERARKQSVTTVQKNLRARMAA